MIINSQFGHLADNNAMFKHFIHCVFVGIDYIFFYAYLVFLKTEFRNLYIFKQN